MFHAFIFLAAASLALAQTPPGWTKPFPAHTIAGNLHYTGTADLACFLVTTPDGHILINTGLASSTPLIRAGIEKLGFKLADVKILLTMQAHFDHVAALAQIQRLTGAKVFATEADAPILEDGGKSDPWMQQNRFAVVKVDRKLKDGDAIRLGGTELIVHLTPGHTKGSVSYSTTVIVEGGAQRRVLIANMNSVVMPLVNNSSYPGIVEDYERAFRVQRALSADIWVAGHASQYDMERKYKAGSFIDPDGYRSAVERYERQFRLQLARERGER